MNREELLAAIKAADKAYYEDDAPTITDEAYDALRKEYIDKYGASDLNYTPGAVAKDFVSFHHPIPVTSLAKIKDGETEKLHKWREKLSPVVLEPKYDGLTVVAYPQKDGSYKYVTRGSGTDGEVLPNFIRRYEGDVFAKGTYTIRGEVFLTKQAFERIKAKQVAAGEEPFKQIRNAAAGILRSKERSPYIDELSYVVYDVVGWDVGEPTKLSWLVDNTPFEVTSFSEAYVIDTPDDYIWKRAKEIFENVGEDTPLDGIVMKTTQDGAIARLGTTEHHVNSQVAIKPSKEIHETTLRDIEFSVGRTKVTPVAIFDPVEIDGTEVTRASIHNKDYFDRMKLCKGDTLFVFKSNEIIPQIDSVIHNGGEPFSWPEDICDSDEILVRDVMHMVSKPVLDIKGFSEKTARKLVENGVITERNDIFDLEVSDIASLDGLGQKSAEKIVRQLDERKDLFPFPRFMRALCIPSLGANVGEIIENAFPSLGEFFSFLRSTEISQQEKFSHLESIDGIGPMTADELASSDFDDAFSDLYSHLRSIKWSYLEKPREGARLAGKSFVLTGKMEHPRSYYEDAIQKAGGTVQPAVSAKTDFLVIADVTSTSSKAQKARKLGTKLVSPEEVLSMCNS